MNSSHRSLLVTGGAGFIGANFVHFWRRRHPDDSITVLDALTYAGNRMNLATLEGQPRFEFVHGDIVDQPLVERVLAERRIDTVVHFAAESHVDRSIAAPDAFVRTNVLGTHALLRACRSIWLGDAHLTTHRFHHISTDEVYGSLGSQDSAFTERTPYAPNSPYAASKAASDHLVRAYVHTYGLQATTSNCSNNYGPFHFPEKLIPLLIVNLLEGRALPIYGDGRNVRDWLYVEDHCVGVELVLDRGRVGETYNIGGRAERENIALAHDVCALVDEAFLNQPDLRLRFPNSPAARGRPSASLIKYVPDRAGHDRRYAIDASKIERELGFAPATPLHVGLRRTIEWFLSEEPWWRSVMDGGYRAWISQRYHQETT